MNAVFLDKPKEQRAHLDLLQDCGRPVELLLTVGDLGAEVGNLVREVGELPSHVKRSRRADLGRALLVLGDDARVDGLHDVQLRLGLELLLLEVGQFGVLFLAPLRRLVLVLLLCRRDRLERVVLRFLGGVPQPARLDAH